ncbi:MAG: sulfatase [Candidatus Neomarinimicrobiota bacterium]
MPYNFLFILVDDLGWTDLKISGSSFYDTPNCDKLAKSGMRFLNAYAACPVCSPTRASIITGRYPNRTGITDWIGARSGSEWPRNTRLLPALYNPQLMLEEVTIAEILKNQGYSTFFAGKWHLGNEGFWPEDQGFDINKGGHHRGGPYGGDKYFSPYGNPRLEDGPDGEHLPDRLASETVHFIEKNKEKPFFAYLSFYSVHTPLLSRKDLEVKYNTRKIKQRLSPKWGTEHKRKVRMVQEHSVYAGMVEAMDMAVGKVLKALERLQLEKNTIIFFMSDNGGLSTSEGHPTSNFPLRAGKGWIYEGGIRVPMIVRWPNMTSPGSVSNAIITSTDFFPTIIELSGAETNLELPIDGISFTPALLGKKYDRGPVFWHYPHYGNQGSAPAGAVREGDWKLIEWYENGRKELYNLNQDISETVDLSKTYPNKVRTLSNKLTQWRSMTEAKMPFVNSRFDSTKNEGR